MVKVFISGFRLEASELELVQLVSPYGTVSTIKIVRDKKTGICKGYAFLEMPERAEAELAVEALDGYPFGSRALKMSLCEAETPAAVMPLYQKVARPSAANRSKRPRRAG